MAGPVFLKSYNVQVDSAAEAVFMGSYIPRKLEEIPLRIAERDQDDIAAGFEPNNPYQTKLSELAEPEPSVGCEPEDATELEEAQEDEEDDEEDDEEGDEEDDDEEEDTVAGTSRKGLSKEENKARKKAIKEANKLKRMEKMKKYDKKHRIKKGTGKSSKR